MRTTTKRSVALAAAATIALGGLVACSPDDDGPDPTDPTDTEDPGGDGDLPYADQRVGAMDDFGVGTTFVATEPVEFGMLYRDHPGYPIQYDWLYFTHLEENHNVTFDLVEAPLSDWEDRRSLLLGAGDAPWIVPSIWPGDEGPFVAGGGIVPVSDYLDLMPNLSDKIESWGLEPYFQNLRQEDGKFYLLPGIYEDVRPEYSFAIRKDIWDAEGLEDPTSFEEFHEQLQTLKDAGYGGDYPYSDRWELNASLSAAAPNFGTLAGWGYGEGVQWTGSEYVYTGAQDGYRDLLEYFAGLVADGLLDPESPTQDDDTAIQKFTSGESIAIGTNDQTVINDYRSAFEDLGDTEAQVHQIVVPAGPAGDWVAGSRTESGIVLSSDVLDSEYFVAVLQFIDWQYYSDEGLEYGKWGVEGETFTRDGDTRVLVDSIDINGLNPGAPESLNADYGFHNGVWMLAHGSTTDLVQSMLRDEVAEFQAGMQAKQQVDLAPAWPLTELEREQATLWQGALNDYVQQSTLQFILGNRSFDEWDSYVAELEGMNLQQYIDLVNEAQQRFAAIG